MSMHDAAYCLASRPRCAVRGCSHLAVVTLGGAVLGEEAFCAQHALALLRDPDALLCDCGCRDECPQHGLCRAHWGVWEPVQPVAAGIG